MGILWMNLFLLSMCAIECTMQLVVLMCLHVGLQEGFQITDEKEAAPGLDKVTSNLGFQSPPGSKINRPLERDVGGGKESDQGENETSTDHLADFLDRDGASGDDGLVSSEWYNMSEDASLANSPTSAEVPSNHLLDQTPLEGVDEPIPDDEVPNFEVLFRPKTKSANVEDTRPPSSGSEVFNSSSSTQEAVKIAGGSGTSADGQSVSHSSLRATNDTKSKVHRHPDPNVEDDDQEPELEPMAQDVFMDTEVHPFSISHSSNSVSDQFLNQRYRYGIFGETGYRGYAFDQHFDWDVEDFALGKSVDFDSPDADWFSAYGGELDENEYEEPHFP